MIVSWDWLKQYVDLDMSDADLAHRLMMAGLNHESTTDVAGDIAIDLEVTSNRPDCLGHIGIAREVAVLYNKILKLPNPTFPESTRSIETLTGVTVELHAADWCPQYIARVIEGVRVEPSPAWLRRRLETVGITPINNVVDVTNYVLFECGQPLHAFDFDRLTGKRIVVRNAAKGEAFLAINNRSYELQAGMGVIADASQPVAVAGVMGGKTTEVSPDTRNILLESAEFTPLSIRRTSRALDLSSDSSYRFERRIDPVGVDWASRRACELITQIAGGQVAKSAIVVGKPAYEHSPIHLRHTRVERILGIAIPPEECERILTALGMQVTTKTHEEWDVVNPSFRRDLRREIDLIEEIGRVFGYDSVPQDRVIPMAVAPLSREQRVLARARGILVAAGFHESMTFSFTDADSVNRVRPWSSAQPIALEHSSRKQENKLRQSLLPSLLDAVRLNESRGNDDVRLFECAPIYLPTGDQSLPEEPIALALAGMVDLRTMRGVVESVFRHVQLTPSFVPTNVPGMADGQAAEYHIEGHRMAVVGMTSPAAKAALDLRTDVALAEINFTQIQNLAHLETRVTPLPDQPAIVRDLAVVFGESIAWAQIESLVRSSAGAHLEELEFVDLYRGKPVDAGHKSIAFRMTFRAPDRTLTRLEVDSVVGQIVEQLGIELGGKLRA